MSDSAIMMSDLLTLVSELVEESTDLSHATEGTLFIDDIGMDSITLVALVFMCEERFDLDLSDKGQEVVELFTLGQTLAFLNECRGVPLT